MHAFHRFTMSALNGLFAAGGISQIYPRVREVECLPLSGCTLLSLLCRLRRSHDRPNLLIFDIPGLEAALLEGLVSGDLENLDWMIIRDGYGSLMEGARPVTEALRILQDSHFSIQSRDEESDLATCIYMLQKDTRLLELKQAKEQISELEALLASQSNLTAGMRSEIETLKKQLAEAHAALEAAGKAKEEQAKLAVERQAGMDALKKELVEAKMMLDAVSKLKDEQSKLAADRQAEIEDLKRHLAQNKQMLEHSNSERHLLSKMSADRAIKIVELETTIAEQVKKEQLIKDEMARVEGQLDLLKEMLKGSL
jgi:DNA repair exonuclease SbcCD ATPase subunit